jgi:alkylated DNA repair protein (DNA oxidative demethylase)
MRATATTAPLSAAQPPGFFYGPDLISAAEERALFEWFATSPAWNEITFRGQTARRRAMSFGARYLTQGRRLLPAPPLPPALVPYRDRMVEAACAGLGPKLALAGQSRADFALCTALHYPPGGGIGWHADNPAFGPTVMSLSLGSPAHFQLRRAGDAGPSAPRFDLQLAPRSLFVLAGEARVSWQHRIRSVDADRYSLTVRSLAPGRGPR